MSGALAGMSPFRDMGRAMFSPLCTRAAAVMTDGLRRRFCTAAATTSQAGLLSTAMASVSGDRSESPYVLRLIWSSPPPVPGGGGRQGEEEMGVLDAVARPVVGAAVGGSA